MSLPRRAIAAAAGRKKRARESVRLPHGHRTSSLRAATTALVARFSAAC